MDQGGWEPIPTPWAKPRSTRARPLLLAVVVALMCLALVLVYAWPIR